VKIPSQWGQDNAVIDVTYLSIGDYGLLYLYLSLNFAAGTVYANRCTTGGSASAKRGSFDARSLATGCRLALFDSDMGHPSPVPASTPIATACSEIGLVGTFALFSVEVDRLREGTGTVASTGSTVTLSPWVFPLPRDRLTFSSVRDGPLSDCRFFARPLHVPVTD